MPNAAPVIRAANRKGVCEIGSEVKALAQRAACGRLQMQQITGGSFSISNLGMYGVDQFAAIISPPQCAILAVARAKPAVAVAAAGDFRVATLLRATLSVDHRAIDGATGAAFLQRLREIVEQPCDSLQS